MMLMSSWLGRHGWVGMVMIMMMSPSCPSSSCRGSLGWQLCWHGSLALAGQPLPEGAPEAPEHPPLPASLPRPTLLLLPPATPGLPPVRGGRRHARGRGGGTSAGRMSKRASAEAAAEPARPPGGRPAPPRAPSPSRGPHRARCLPLREPGALPPGAHVPAHPAPLAAPAGGSRRVARSGDRERAARRGGERGSRARRPAEVSSPRRGLAVAAEEQGARRRARGGAFLGSVPAAETRGGERKGARKKKKKAVRDGARRRATRREATWDAMLLLIPSFCVRRNDNILRFESEPTSPPKKKEEGKRCARRIAPPIALPGGSGNKPGRNEKRKIRNAREGGGKK